MKRDLLSFALWSGEDLKQILNLTSRLRDRSDGSFRPLANRGVGLVFERESLRTRVSFEVGVVQLGGHPVFLQQDTIGIATRESVHDIGLVLSEYAALIVARTTRHQTCAQLAESSTVPLINAMTDLLHPCQILTDAFTLQELSLLSPETRIVFIGHGNNIANSWLELAEKIPLHLVLCCPDGYEPHAQILEQSRAAGVSTIELVNEPTTAVRDAGVVYTDVWPDMHGGGDAGKRILQFKPYQVNRHLLQHAKPDCVVMHRLPANRGEEITSDVLDGKHSVALRQAANRMHVQKAVMATLLGAMAD
jgi:ornithine carbamoyltransferase